MTADAPTRFRLRAAVAVRMIGAGCILLAIAVACWVLTAWNATILMTGAALLVTVLGALVLIAGITLAVVRPTLLHLGDFGLRNRTGRAVGIRSLAWSDVTDIAWSQEAFGPILVVRLADGNSSRIQPDVLNASDVTVENAIRTFADAAHGYRPL